MPVLLKRKKDVEKLSSYFQGLSKQWANTHTHVISIGKANCDLGLFGI